jgi:hypothetical protein
MVSKCANPACSASFRYLHEGRIFSIYSHEPASPLRDWSDTHQVVERYWLCPECARMMTLVLRRGEVVVQRFPAQTRGAHAA